MSISYTLVAVPGDTQEFSRINKETRAAELSTLNSMFQIPISQASASASGQGLNQGLKVGTLDKLMALSQDLEKHEGFGQATADRIIDFAFRLLLTRTSEPLGGADGGPAAAEEEERRNAAKIALKQKMRLNSANPDFEEFYSVETYVEKFEWCRRKYDYNLYPTELVAKIIQEISQLDAEIKRREAKFAKLRQTVEANDKRKFGNLMQKPLEGVVLPRHFPEVSPTFKSEHLVTLLFCVPAQSESAWFESYENLFGDIEEESSIDSKVVPESSQVIARDKEYVLVNVTLFENIADLYKKQAQKKRFLFRDYTYSPVSEYEGEYEYDGVVREDTSGDSVRAELEKAKKDFLHHCEVTFSEAFTALMHIKAIRLFVESILRYGLPPKFVCICMKVRAGQEKKLRTKLDEMYRHLDQEASGAGGGDAVIPASLSGLDDQSFRPYVCLDVKLDFK